MRKVVSIFLNPICRADEVMGSGFIHFADEGGSGTPRILPAGGGVRTQDRDEGRPVPAGGFMAACCARTALLRCSAGTPSLLGSSRPLSAASPPLPHRGARRPRARGTLGKRLSARRRASGARMRAALRTNRLPLRP